ncbi:MAG: hypothetical protein US76_04300 [Parcubacteria group bacterium GW2011_GWA2_38_13b]|nr:MAG: hypothetical protein US76_04300 [Parcubacteria group bacterium GW2011_GWA2_38_13b]
MYITYYGYTCFKIQSQQKITAITDIFDKSIGLKPPFPKADILTYSCSHFDCSDTAEKNSENQPFIINSPGEYEISGIAIDGIPAKHGEKLQQESFDTALYVFRTEGMSLCHLGDLGQKELNDNQLEAIGEIDILMVPVGGNYTIDYKSAAHIVNQIEPRLVIPMAYHLPNMKVELDKIDLFFKEIGISPKEKIDKLKITKKDLPPEEMEVVEFKI